MVNNYSIYAYDIRPKGFQVIEMDNFISDSTMTHAEEVFSNPELSKQMGESNYILGEKYYSYEVLEQHLTRIIEYLVHNYPNIPKTVD